MAGAAYFYPILIAMWIAIFFLVWRDNRRRSK